MIEAKGKVTKSNFIAKVRYAGLQNKKLMDNYDTEIINSDYWQHFSWKFPIFEELNLGWVDYQKSGRVRNV